MEETRSDGPRWRIDLAHRIPPDPHMFTLPKKPEIRLLMVQLDDDDVELRSFSRRLAKYPGLYRYVVAYANYMLPSRERRVSDASHAMALLGIRRVHDVLGSLIDDTKDAAQAG